MPPINYVVFDRDGNYIAVVTAYSVEDVKAYYKSIHQYYVEVRPLQIVNVAHGFASKSQEIEAKKAALQKQIRDLDDEIKRME